MSKYSHIIFVSALFFANQSFAQCTIDTITQRLSETKLNASFVQSKKIPALENVLKSEGSIWLSEKAELVWQVDKPIKSTMVIKQGDIIQYNRKDQRIDSRKAVAPSGLAGLFYSIASGDFAALSEQFEIELQCNQLTWEVLLQPKDQQISQFIKELRLTGAEQINSFSYLEKRGDNTQVELTHLKTPLSSELARYLD